MEHTNDINEIFANAIDNQKISFIDSKRLRECFTNAGLPFVGNNISLVYDFINKADNKEDDLITKAQRPARKYYVGKSWIKLSILDSTVILEWASTSNVKSKLTLGEV